MAPKLSPQTASKIMVLLFQGKTEDQIAHKLNIDQTTVTKYKGKLKELVQQVGITKASEEFGVAGIVDALHSLSVELADNHMTVAESRVGLRMSLLLEKYGIDQDEYGACIKALKRMQDEGFIVTVIKLCKLGESSGLSAEEIVANATSEYKELLKYQQANKDLSLELKASAGMIATAKQELAGINSQKEAAGKALKKYMDEAGIDLNRVKALEPLSLALKKAGTLMKS